MLVSPFLACLTPWLWMGMDGSNDWSGNATLRLPSVFGFCPLPLSVGGGGCMTAEVWGESAGTSLTGLSGPS